MKQYRIRVFGKVQGVAFRYYTQLKANELKLKGITKNLDDGSVETIVFGPENKVNQFIDWCGEGSPASIVDRVLIEDMTGRVEYEFEDFSILR